MKNANFGTLKKTLRYLKKYGVLLALSILPEYPDRSIIYSIYVAMSRTE